MSETKELKNVIQKSHQDGSDLGSFFGTVAKYHWQSIMFVLVLFAFTLVLRQAHQKLNFPETKGILNWFGFIVLANLLITYIIMITYRHVKSQRGLEGPGGYQGPIGDKGHTQNCGICNEEIKTMEQPFNDVAIRQPVLPAKLNLKPKGDLIPKLKKETPQFATGRLKLNTISYFWKHSNFRGSRYAFKPGNHAWIGKSKNDKISSLKIPDGYWVTVYQHARFRGRRRTFMGGHHPWIGGYMNDRTSSIKIYKIPTKHAVLFQHFYWEGLQFWAGGRHPTLGSMNKRASGIFIPKGYKLTVYSEYHYRGWKKTIGQGHHINIHSLKWENAPSRYNLGDRIKSVILTKA